MSKNGQLSDAELTVVGTVRLATVTARAWQALAAAASDEAHVSVRIALPHGGYRDLDAQRALHSGTAASNPLSTIKIAAPGHSTHGFGNRVDVGSFHGIREKWLLDNCRRFGFTREFGAADPNHFIHNGVVPASAVSLPLEDTLSAAEVAEIKSHLSAEVNRMLTVVSRESRPRLYRSDPQQGGTGAIMAVRMESGYVREFRTPESLEVLKLLGLIATEEAMNVDPGTYEGIKNESNAERTRLVDAVVAAVVERSQPARIDAADIQRVLDGFAELTRDAGSSR